jgi:hypothetical protein
MKPKIRSLKQRGRDARFVAEIQSLLGDPLKWKLADRLRNGDLACVIDCTGELRLDFILDSHPLGLHCERCGCTELDACVDPKTGAACAWARPGLCTACLTKEEEKPLRKAGLKKKQ